MVRVENLVSEVITLALKTVQLLFDSRETDKLGAEDFGDYRTQLLPWAACQPRVAAYCDALGMPQTGEEFAGALRAAHGAERNGALGQLQYQVLRQSAGRHGPYGRSGVGSRRVSGGVRACGNVLELLRERRRLVAPRAERPNGSIER